MEFRRVLFRSTGTSEKLPAISHKSEMHSTAEIQIGWRSSRGRSPSDLYRMLALPCGAGIAYNPRPAISGSTMGANVTSKNSDRAAVYSRYSTDKQDPSSIEDQVRVCTRLEIGRAHV